MKEDFFDKVAFYFIIGVCSCNILSMFAFPFIVVSAFVCARLTSMNRSEKLFTKEFWFTIISLIIFWVIIYTIFWMMK